MSTTTRPKSILSFFRDDFRMESWLLAGASLQAITFVMIGRSAILLVAALVLYQVFMYALKDHGFVESEARKGVRLGRWSTQVPHNDGTPSIGPGEEQVTVFMLAARSNHPRGRFAPGCSELGQYFSDMWRDASRSRETNGFLGKTSALFGTDLDCSNTTYWLSYWKNLEALQAFANSSVHTKGLRWYLDVASKKHPDIGLLHETYSVPKGHWETIAWNSKPFGLAATKHFASSEKDDNRHEVDIVVNASKDQMWNKMADRMAKRVAAI